MRRRHTERTSKAPPSVDGRSRKTHAAVVIEEEEESEAGR